MTTEENNKPAAKPVVNKTATGKAPAEKKTAAPKTKQPATAKPTSAAKKPAANAQAAKAVTEQTTKPAPKKATSAAKPDVPKTVKAKAPAAPKPIVKTPETFRAPAVASSAAVPPSIDNISPTTPAKPVHKRPVKVSSAVQQSLLVSYWKLMRLDKPIGILLLLWPTLWSLWLAAKGVPRWDLLIIFSVGALVMRSAGCVINDFADRKIDGKVARTKDRPLATGAISSAAAIVLFVLLCAMAFGLVLLTDPLTIKLSIGGLALAFCYPFMKRHTHLPQVVLGAAFAWGIPMAFTAQTGELKHEMWLIYFAVVLWTVVYDTFYAMVDRDDDLKIGVKSTAILFGEQDRMITAVLQIMVLGALVLVGQRFELGKIYYLSLVVVAGLFSYQQVLIRYRERTACFKAFLNNNWVGAAVFVGIAGDFALK